MGEGWEDDTWEGVPWQSPETFPVDGADPYHVPSDEVDLQETPCPSPPAGRRFRTKAGAFSKAYAASVPAGSPESDESFLAEQEPASSSMASKKGKTK